MISLVARAAPTALVAAVLLAAPAAAQVKFSGSGRQATLECRGGTVEIVGGRNDLRIRGPCRKVEVTGAANVLAVESAGAIEVSGSMNRVRWQQAQDGRPPRVSSTGLGNTVVRGPSSAPVQAASAPREAVDVAAVDDSGGAGPLELLSDGVQRTLDCRGRRLALMGSRNVLRLRGRCPLVNVSGDDNRLTVDTPDAIVVTGDRNDVGWASTRAPKVTNTGRQNRVGPERP